MTWFAAHELFGELHRLRGEIERLLAGEAGGLALASLETVVRAAEAARRLEGALRQLGESETVKGRRLRLEPVPARQLLGALGLEGAVPDPQPVLTVPAALAGARTAVRMLCCPRPPAALVRIRVCPAHLLLWFPQCGGRVKGTGEGAIRRRHARRLLRASGAMVRTAGSGVLLSWRRVPTAGSGPDVAPLRSLDGGVGGS